MGSAGLTAQAGLNSCLGSATQASTTGPNHGPLRVHSGEQQHGEDGGSSIWFPGEHLRLINLIWSDVHVHRLFSIDLENGLTRSRANRSPRKVGFRCWINSTTNTTIVNNSSFGTPTLSWFQEI